MSRGPRCLLGCAAKDVIYDVVRLFARKDVIEAQRIPALGEAWVVGAQGAGLHVNVLLARSRASRRSFAHTITWETFLLRMIDCAHVQCARRGSTVC